VDSADQKLHQSVTLWVDPGFTYVGLSAITEKQELYAADVALRNDMNILSPPG
jgi:hypothetical protein